jgi:hypothetical protein
LTNKKSIGVTLLRILALCIILQIGTEFEHLTAIEYCLTNQDAPIALSSTFDPRVLEGGFITRDRMMEIAEGYKTHRWTPTTRNIYHGQCEDVCGGSASVDTPDRNTYPEWGNWKGWVANQENIGIPYQWGGFSSIAGYNLIQEHDFDDQISRNYYAGDARRETGCECPLAAGVDCSGFVARSWNLPWHPGAPHPSLSDFELSWPIEFKNLKRGDILDGPGHPGHVMLFKEFVTPERTVEGETRIRTYEASGKDSKVSEWEYRLLTIKPAEEEWRGVTFKTNRVTLEVVGRVNPESGILEAIKAGFRDGIIYTPRTYNPIKWGLIWLREHQKANGSWRDNVGITSMAVLAFLNEGYKDDPSVARALSYILSRRNSDNSFGSAATYETSLAILALIATHNPDYRDEIEAAKNWLLQAQYDEGEGANSENPSYGGWRYGLSPSDGDLSNTQFALMALDAAYKELGLRKPSLDDPTAWPYKAIRFISRCQNRAASNDQPWAQDPTRPSYNDGGFIYHPIGWSLAGGTKSYGSMTAAGIWSLRLCGISEKDIRIKDALDWLKRNEDCSFDDNPGHPYNQGNCFLYYYYMSLSKALLMTFETDLICTDWYSALVTELLNRQQNDGHWQNVYASHGQEDIPELATVYSLLALQVKRPLPPTKLWMSIILASNADLHVYDPQGRHAGMNYETGQIENKIPGATFGIDSQGRQIVTLPQLEAGTYRLELVGIRTGPYSLTIKGYRDEEETSSETIEGTIEKGQDQVSTVTITSIVGELTINVEIPETVPSGLVAIPGDTVVALRWNPYDTKFNLKGYNVYRSITSHIGYTKINPALVTETEYHDSGLTNGVTYYYVVTAVDDLGNETGYSREVSATPEGVITLFFDDLEPAPEAGWNLTGLWHLVDNTPCVSPGYSSSTHAWYFGNDKSCSYSKDKGDLWSPAIALPQGVSQIAVSFNYFLDLGGLSQPRPEWFRAAACFYRNNGRQITCKTIWDLKNASFGHWTATGDLMISVPPGAVKLKIQFAKGKMAQTAKGVGWLIDDVKVRAVVSVSSLEANEKINQPLQLTNLINIPNPITGTARFLAQGQGIKEIRIEVYDLSGRLIFSSGWVSNDFSWPAIDNQGNPLANGVYLYLVTLSGYEGDTLKSQVKKLVILR